jgi:hypothetical protein
MSRHVAMTPRPDGFVKPSRSLPCAVARPEMARQAISAFLGERVLVNSAEGHNLLCHPRQLKIIEARCFFMGLAASGKRLNCRKVLTSSHRPIEGNVQDSAGNRWGR